MQEELLSVKDYAKTQTNPRTGKLGISVQAVYAKIRYGTVEAVRLGHMTLIKVK